MKPGTRIWHFDSSDFDQQMRNAAQAATNDPGRPSVIRCVTQQQAFASFCRLHDMMEETDHSAFGNEKLVKRYELSISRSQSIHRVTLAVG